ncbi:MAG: hypothetical protein FWG65_12865 [Turicibacter sp.]|nr:hypothetical protein [Turicibacter sp.]
MPKINYCAYCGKKLTAKCRCEEKDDHIYDFLLVDSKDEFMMSYSEERAMLERAEYLCG